MIYIEPTPYVTALVDTVRRIWDGPVEAYYVTTDLTQRWALQIDAAHGAVLPAGFFARLRALRSVLRRDPKRTIVHLAGWGHAVLFGVMLTAAMLRLPMAVESDTPVGRPARTWRRLLKALFYPYLLRLPDRFLPAGTRQASYLARFGVAARRMTIAQMTVDVRAIRGFCADQRAAIRSEARARWAIPSDAPVVLYVGRLESYKGVEVLLAAFARAAACAPDLHLVAVGDGTLRPRVEAAAASLGGRLKYLARLSGNELLRAYLAADFFVLPSLSEPWGLAINEAMACGLPVVASDRVGCVDDLIKPERTGMVVAAGREDELASAILRLAGDPTARRRMGEAAERLIAPWTLDNEARNIASAWREISP